MSDGVDDDLAELRNRTSHGDRLDEAAADDRRRDLVDGLVARLDQIENGDAAKTVSVWDGRLAALFQLLAPPEDNPDDYADERAALAEALRDRLDVDDDTAVDRSELIRLTLHAGLEAAGPEYREALRDAVRERATRDL
jgi:hypothetical protein